MSITKLVTLTQPQSPAAEAYRTLRANLHFAALDAPVRSLVITAPSSQEDKTLSVANLAVVLAQAEKRVIVVDADLRQPGLHALFQLDNTAGLLDALNGAPLEQVVQPTSVAGLSVLSSGKLLATPSDVFSSTRMGKLIGHLTTLADMVLFDTPPALLFSDAALLASQTDGVLLVIAAGKTRREDAQLAKETLERARARLLGAVMLDAPADRTLRRAISRSTDR
ncbi:MAG: CpsD/CapB family tyrosine-protein kinase [Anaerolineae bacterium]|nr:CpsD/CapB family tyrosine-protein kinase [Thermoflexales bacterium]MDW8406998.1 CpsD/CapB family tyrosine-protein kinase [Anaerolineae bacterium]